MDGSGHRCSRNAGLCESRRLRASEPPSRKPKAESRSRVLTPKLTAQIKRSPDAGTSRLLTRENCSRRESRAERILECINRADCDHLYQRVTQCARAFPAIKPVWSTKAAARNYYDGNAAMPA